jgi:hypothetical protein
MQPQRDLPAPPPLLPSATYGLGQRGGRPPALGTLARRLLKLRSAAPQRMRRHGTGVSSLGSPVILVASVTCSPDLGGTVMRRFVLILCAGLVSALCCRP